MSLALLSRQALLVSLIIGLCLLLPMVFNQGVASAYHFKSRYYLDVWKQKSTATESQYRDALNAANKAYTADKSSPHYAMTLANVMEWGVYSGFDSFENNEFNTLFTQAIALRANWPPTYSDYAYNLAFYQNSPDLAFEQLRIGLKYGPFSAEVIEQILSVGLASWPVISMDDKYLVFDTLKTAATMGHETRRHLINTVGLYDKKALVCSYFNYLPQPLPESSNNWVKQTLCKKG